MAETTNDSKSAEVADLEKENQALKAQIEGKDKIIEALKVELKEAKAPQQATSATPTVKVGKDTYEIVIGRFSYDGETYTAADVAKDEKLAAALVKEGSGVLVKKS
ncbi:hypothetical protein [Runella zeae]|uniref:hypothetical protein n=1 Tax=Runella zeae TaxID=94255 RepID=UPI00041DBEA9|nr:hypothetical protein [Runella zeae]